MADLVQYGVEDIHLLAPDKVIKVDADIPASAWGKQSYRNRFVARKLFDYDMTLGVLRWKEGGFRHLSPSLNLPEKSYREQYQGKVAGIAHSHFGVIVPVNTKWYQAQAICQLILDKDWYPGIIAMRNGNILDLRPENLVKGTMENGVFVEDQTIPIPKTSMEGLPSTPDQLLIEYGLYSGVAASAHFGKGWTFDREFNPDRTLVFSKTTTTEEVMKTIRTLHNSRVNGRKYKLSVTNLGRDTEKMTIMARKSKCPLYQLIRLEEQEDSQSLLYKYRNQQQEVKRLDSEQRSAMRMLKNTNPTEDMTEEEFKDLLSRAPR